MTQQLTARQEAFCRAFVGGAGSAAEAARQAGYAANTARAQASRLLHTPAVMDRVDALRADRERAQAALSARLMAEVEAVRARAVERGDDRMVLRSVDTQMRLARQFGLPEVPPDSFDVACEGVDGAPAPTWETDGPDASDTVDDDTGDGDTVDDGTADDPAADDAAVLTHADAVARESTPAATGVNGTDSGRVRDLCPAGATGVDGCERPGTHPGDTGTVRRADPDILDRPPGHSRQSIERVAAGSG